MPISFARGAPAPECYDLETLGDCARTAIEREGAGVLSYGSGAGYAPLRAWIGEQHGVDPGRVLITNGSLQGFVFLVSHVLRHLTKRVLVERPTYDRPLLLLEQLGADVVPVPMDDEGLDLDALEAALPEGEPSLLYTIPTFQNPTGRTLSTERRRRLVELARERDVLLLEDDPYSLVRFGGEPEPSLFELAGGEGVVYSSSFSKTIAPGLRVGYFVLPESLERAVELAATSTYITPVLPIQATVYELIRRGGFEPNLERMVGLLRARRDAMLGALDAHFPREAEWSRPDGGYFLWLDVPGTRADALLAAAERDGVVFVKGADFGGGPSTVRLAFSFASPEEIETGIERLAALLPAAAAA
jgi:2-aminoadipate transaminase